MKTSQSINIRIVRGENASTPIPWQVHVHFSPHSDCQPRNGTCSCGGTILDETTILSAAHCFYAPWGYPPAKYIEAGIKARASLNAQKISVLLFFSLNNVLFIA